MSKLVREIFGGPKGKGTVFKDMAVHSALLLTTLVTTLLIVELGLSRPQSNIAKLISTMGRDDTLEGALPEPDLNRSQNEGILMTGQDDGTTRFKYSPIMQHVPDDHPLKVDMLAEGWMLEDRYIMYRSDAAIKFAKESEERGRSSPYFEKGVIYGISGASRVGGQGRGIDDALEVFLRYLGEVEKSASSLRRVQNSDLGIALVVDLPIEHMPDDKLWLFDYIIYNRISEESRQYYPHGMGWSVKPIVMLHTPFEKTLFVDADTMFCASPEEEFDALKIASIALAREQRLRDTSIMRQMRLDINSGVIAYRKNKIISVLMRDVTRQLIKRQTVGDQPIFGSQLRQFEKYGNLRYHILKPRFHLQSCREDKSGCVIDGEVVVIHGRCFGNISKPKGMDNFCANLNTYQGTRLILTDCHQLHVFKLDATERSNPLFERISAPEQANPTDDMHDEKEEASDESLGQQAEENSDEKNVSEESN
mmetsp:Transcript_12905/g.39706  ORF Transcript_12905/g.39706 Transcript_12905/m.39706 type:complete len:479 (+) Transcript_12905:305-1741(+)|eukprot:CAMPEP_0198726220 /NCGR_PEP_ID=MMETSP1475-20131203/3344_1 /TAXON_ID= ORGANISM="Unidentified sp., Strain CCMP1999" /NCGR_SAMPLE_ID=MMETSP1475 /ASSEMBLY_ACC=CAM_ASM_001111 /LENGTH=478 /DNA_ID=CAMNT_0044488123 /DNA_START=223 /DNA_END=1659 /DNA_ORIENTATION=+